MRTRAPLTFDRSQEQVEGMMERGTAFSDVGGRLAEEQKCAVLISSKTSVGWAWGFGGGSGGAWFSGFWG